MLIPARAAATSSCVHSSGPNRSVVWCIPAFRPASRSSGVMPSMSIRVALRRRWSLAFENEGLHRYVRIELVVREEPAPFASGQLLDRRDHLVAHRVL